MHLHKIVISTVLLFNINQSQAEPFLMGAIGDSITAGFNAGGSLDQKKNSWAAGSNINSHAVKIKSVLGRDVLAENVSKSGATIADLPRQTSLLLKNDFAPDYVTILIGANDICTGREDGEDLSQNGRVILGQTIERIIQTNSSVKILLAAVPNLIHLRKTMENNPSCLKHWKRLNVCPSILLASPERLARSYQTWADFNKMLSEFASEYPENVRFESVTSEAIFSNLDVSNIDCFHPSVKGQELLSDLTWKQLWWSE